MADPARARKVADRIKVIVAEYLEYKLKDERLGFVTITDVRLTGDLQHASIFYTVFGGEAARTGTSTALESARGKIRSAVGKGIGIRLTPSIEFIADAIPEGAAHLEGLLQSAKQRDADLAAAASGATFAGDPDPYKKSAADEAAETEGAGDSDDGDADDGHASAELGGAGNAGS